MQTNGQGKAAETKISLHRWGFKERTEQDAIRSDSTLQLKILSKLLPYNHFTQILR
uniref:Uncharacterized protein n=1 Tax=Rhizophora mucronata TaxID=61149 RepID=A0A2P2JS27_RHIMU